MGTNRRLWIKQMSLIATGIGLSGFKTFAAGRHSNTGYRVSALQTSDAPIILRANENPYGPSPLARQAITDHISITNRYNWELAPELITALAKKNDVNEENILLGAGSTEILDLTAKLAASGQGNYVIADPSYDYWTSTLDGLGLQKIKVSCSKNKEIDLTAMLRAITKETRLVYICNPNNPTGTLLYRKSLEEFIATVPLTTLILVDEAYLDFTEEQSLADLTKQYPNLIIAKTFSKIYGLAGARIGYAIAHKATIDKLSSLQSNTNNSVSVLSKLAAIASLKDRKFVMDCYKLNAVARAYTIAALGKLNCRCIPSHTNFIYFSLADYTKDYFKLLESANIQGTRFYEEQGKWTRITVGKMDEMKAFINAIS